MMANSHYLPRYKNPMVTEDYMRDILCGQSFCPHYEDFKLLQCLRPPTVEVLIRKFHLICGNRNILNNCGVDELHKPDKRWLLDFVSTFKPIDGIFPKDNAGPPGLKF
jgi:hypothetical protein